ncbi:MAG: hypothetical protein NTY93_03425 [Candidatus Kaiserbacteria bacterium]|nr:hypothetical protein [Candidatus Kaiserbacteria bacterium]
MFGAILATIGAIIGLSYQVPVLGFVEFFVTASQVIGIIMFVVGTVKALYPIMK